ncbi:MAG: tetratricopeptide repeat protein [Proteobacteria bacterium]|nr:tetratricopeptide repeat protein [Pseudomonadota bacterium]
MKIFLSAVSSQFKACRDALRSDLSTVGAEVVVQEDFQQHGFSLLEKLEQYVASCDRVIALIGDGYGWEPEQSARPAGRPRRSYTQWEYYFARGERLDGSAEAPKPLYVYFAAPEFIAALGTAGDADPEGLQREFVAEIRGSGKDWNEFKSHDELRALVLRDGFRLDEHDPKLRDRPQRAVVRGNYNIVVQILGDANRVDIGRPLLSLVRYGELAVRDTVGLLYAQARAIPVFGREETLNGLEAWANSASPISIRVIVGGGGSGKTRLAMELCDRLTDVGWDAGFLTAAELSRFRAQQNLATWGWSRHTLVVIDYAAARAASLNAWLGELASNPGTSNTPLRLLLLERHADPGSGWWQAAFGAGGVSAYAIQGLLDPPQPVKLLPLAPPQRRQVLDAMLEKLGSRERVPAGGADPQFDHRLANLTWGGDPLYLMMAASRAAQAGLGGLLALNRTELVKAVAREERARLAKHAQASSLPGEVLCHMAAFVTLCGGLDWVALADAVPAELQALRRPSAGDPADIANALREALPGIEGTIAPILPDAVGEGFVLEVLDRSGAAPGVVKRAWELKGLAVADMLIRCAQDFGQAEREPPLTWLQSLADEADEAGTLNALLQRVPKSTVILRSFATRLSRRIVETLAQDDPTPCAQAFRADALNELAIRLSKVGDWEGAMAPARAAVEVRRNLVAKNPHAFLPDLAMSLNNLANRLSEAGDQQGALARAREAVEIRSELAKRNADAFRPDLAMLLNDLAACLLAADEPQGALAPARDAVKIYRKLAKRNADAFGPDLAASLNNLAISLRNLGKPQRALAPAHKAVKLCREAVAKDPDAFRPLLATSLSNLARLLSQLGEPQRALAPAYEALETLRPAFLCNPRAFAQQMERMEENYLECCRDHAFELHKAFLGPIVAQFQKMQGEE